MLNKMRQGDKAPKGKPVATVQINGAGDMLPEERDNLAKWLRSQATMLTKQGDEYAPRFTGRYLV